MFYYIYVCGIYVRCYNTIICMSSFRLRLDIYDLFRNLFSVLVQDIRVEMTFIRIVMLNICRYALVDIGLEN